MKGALEELESCQTLFLVGICEPFENQLQILLQEAKTHQDQPRPTIIAGVDLGISYPIGPAEDSRFFQLDWQKYIAYLVTDESYGVYPVGEQFTGKNLRVFADSAYLRFLRETTNATDGYPGPYQQYEIVSQMHVVDVAAEEPPEITILSKTQVASATSHVCRVAFARDPI
jgi:hypothetical protein